MCGCELAVATVVPATMVSYDTHRVSLGYLLVIVSVALGYTSVARWPHCRLVGAMRECHLDVCALVVEISVCTIALHCFCSARRILFDS